jgi:OFA family oxalate/formate antiporter-like MFS transporter
MQMCLGATYSWSIYVSTLKELTGLNQGFTQLPFSLFYFAFPATMMLSGTLLLPRFGPRRCAVAGGLIFGSGWLLAVLGKIDFTFTVMGIGLLAGIGAGVAYIIPITVCIQWFPKHKGLVTGIAVAGFGGGAALVSLLGGILIDGWGITPFETFAILGVSFLILVPLAGLFMRYVPNVEKRKLPRLKSSVIVGRKGFQILYIAMFTGLAAGFAVNANLKELYSGQSVKAGIMAVSLFAVANALGRIIWGVIVDRIRSSAAIQANLISQAIVLLIALLLLSSTLGFLVISFLVGFNYGGVLVVYASAVAQIWGDSHVAQVYGLLFSANILAAVSPVLVGVCYEIFGNFNFPVCCLAILMLSAALLVRKNTTVIDLEGGYANESTKQMSNQTRQL